MHNALLKQDYEEATKGNPDDPYGYEWELYKTLEHVITECDRKGQKATQRLQAQDAENATVKLFLKFLSYSTIFTKKKE